MANRPDERRLRFAHRLMTFPAVRRLAERPDLQRLSWRLSVVVLAFIVLRFRSRLRFFPLGQQALAVLALLLNDRVVTLMIRGFSGEAMPPATFWIAPLVGTLAWPLLYVLLDNLRLRQRAAD